MRITLKRRVALKSAVVYLKMRTETQREDIKKYLESDGFSNPIIEKRVKNYLRAKGIYDNQDQLTTEGQSVKRTGRVKEPEEGKYQIWYTQDDPLFKNRIFYFRRIKPVIRDNLQMEQLDINYNNEIHTHTSLPIMGKDGSEKDGRESVEFSIDSAKWFNDENIVGADIDCEWIWNELKTAFFKFRGKLDWTDADVKMRKDTVKSDNVDETKELDFHIDFSRYIPQIIPDWNKLTGRLKLKLENIKTDDVYQYFKYSGPRPREGFDSCDYDEFPVEPYDHEEAIRWRNRLLEMEFKKNYVHPDDFDGKVFEINEKDGFAAYEMDMDNIDIYNYIKEHEPGKKSARSVAYWHIAAPLDLNLNPSIPQSLRLDSFSLKNGDNISFGEIASKFTGGFSAEKVFYFDNYVVKYFQQRSAAAFLKCFGVSGMCIITDKNNQDFNDYLSENEPNITVEDICRIYPNRKDAPHDRFLILKHGNELRIWTSANSIDYIRFDKNIRDIQRETLGNVRKSVTFTQVPQNVQGRQLIEFILQGDVK